MFKQTDTHRLHKQDLSSARCFKAQHIMFAPNTRHLTLLKVQPKHVIVLLLTYKSLKATNHSIDKIGRFARNVKYVGIQA